MRLPPDLAARGFRELLCEAAAAVGPEWFLLPVASEDSRAPARHYRERVYCYEIYHQIRLLSGRLAGLVAGSPEYRLSGEIDKAGLNAVIEGGRHKPDLVWHVPGRDNGNATVVEVKTIDGSRSVDLRKDLATLAAFLESERGYHSAILLVFGDAGTHADTVRQRALRRAAELGLIPPTRQRIELLWHWRHSAPPVSLGTLEDPT
jgi:hypothetical protein